MMLSTEAKTATLTVGGTCSAIARITLWPSSTRIAEVAVQQAAIPAQQLHGEWLVEPELLADVLHLVAGGADAGQHQRRIAGHELHQRERQQRNDRHDDQRGEQAPDDEAAIPAIRARRSRSGRRRSRPETLHVRRDPVGHADRAELEEIDLVVGALLDLLERLLAGGRIGGLVELLPQRAHLGVALHARER